MLEKTLCGKDFIKEFERDIYMKIVVTIIPTNLVTNPLLYLFYSVKKKKQTKRDKKQISNFQQFGGLVTRNNFSFCL